MLIKKIFLVMLLVFSNTIVYAQKIMIELVNDSIKRIHFSQSDESFGPCEIVFSPDSQLCGVINYRSEKFMIYDYNANLRGEGRIKNGTIRISNDCRVVEILENSGENWISVNDVQFYNQSFKIVKDTVLFYNTDAYFAPNGFLVIIHSSNLLGFRSSKTEKDTKVLIYDKNFQLKFQDLIIYPNRKLSPPKYISESNEYILPFADSSNTVIGSVRIKPD